MLNKQSNNTRDQIDVDPWYLIKSVAACLKDPVYVKQAVLCSASSFGWAVESVWQDASLETGYPGLICLFAYLNGVLPNEGWEQILHPLVKAVKNSIESDGVHSLSLFNGLAGASFALQRAAKQDCFYRKISDQIHAILVKRTSAFLRVDKNDVPESYLFDLKEGITGLGLYYLHTLHLDCSCSILESILILLIQRLSTSSTFKNFEISFAHGLNGLIAFLSICLLKGIERPKQREILQLLVDHMQVQEAKIKSSRYDAWCCGSASHARALLLGARALQNPYLAKQAISDFSKKSISDWKFLGPGLCHGLSSILLLTHLMAKETGSIDLIEKTALLKNQLLTHYDQSFIFGFKELALRPNGSYIEFYRVGLLGCAGILLTLASTEKGEMSWCTPFGLGVY